MFSIIICSLFAAAAAQRVGTCIGSGLNLTNPSPISTLTNPDGIEIVEAQSTIYQIRNITLNEAGLWKITSINGTERRVTVEVYTCPPYIVKYPTVCDEVVLNATYQNTLRAYTIYDHRNQTLVAWNPTDSRWLTIYDPRIDKVGSGIVYKVSKISSTDVLFRIEIITQEDTTLTRSNYIVIPNYSGNCVDEPEPELESGSGSGDIIIPIAEKNTYMEMIDVDNKPWTSKEKIFLTGWISTSIGIIFIATLLHVYLPRRRQKMKNHELFESRSPIYLPAENHHLLE